MDHIRERENTVDICNNDRASELVVIHKSVGHVALSIDRPDKQYEVPPTYPNDREWAQMNLLA